MSFDLALVNNDLSISVSGTIQTVTDTPKLRQDIIKIIVTPLGSVKRHLWYGCSLGDDVIGKQVADILMMSVIKLSASKSLERLKALQISQSTFQSVSLAEMIDYIGGVSVERDANDPRQVNVLITVFSKRLGKIEEIFTIIS